LKYNKSSFMNDQEKMVWESHSRQWDLVGAPLKPSAQDGVLMMELGTSCLGLSQTVKRIAILGVTPELIQLDWPQGVELEAFDHSEPMLQSVWAPNPKFASRVTLASWQALPVDDAHFDLVVGDGSFNALPSLVEYAPVFQELARISCDQAALVLRCFVRPDEAESMTEIKHAAMSGRVYSFHALKWRIAMSLATKNHGAVAVREVYDTFEAHFDRENLARISGCPITVINTIDAYKMADTVYTFPTLAQWRDCCQPLWRVDQVLYADYELAQRCPTLRFVRESFAA
jgi:hypothetical protein